MCPFRLIWLHVVLIGTLLFASASASSSSLSSKRGGCPFSSLLAFQSSPAQTQTQTQSQRPTTNMIPAKAHTLPTAPRGGRPDLLRPRRAMSSQLRSSVAEPQTAAAVDEAQAKAEKEADNKRRKAQASEPLEVHVIGLSHHNAKVEIRERLAVPEADWNAASSELCNNPDIAEAATLSTCNRFEVYISAQNARAAIGETLAQLEKRSGLSQQELRQNLFILSGDDAVWHLLRVSAGLDSLVVGEGQILSQVRQCYLHGTEEGGSAGKVVARLLNTAVTAGKRARSETSISKGAVSISSAAAEFSKFRCDKDLGKDFSSARISIIGAGTMSRLLLIHLNSLGIKKITLVNRSMPKCLELQEEFPDMEFDIRLADELERTIMDSDVVYTSTSATGCIVTKPQLERLGAGSKSGSPVMLVDISVPRNVEAECNEVDGVFAYDVDDLKMVVARNTALRRREMLEAENILHEEMGKFRGWQESLTAIPAISKMQEKFEAMRSDEVRKAGNKLGNLSKKEMEVVEKLSKSIVNKMLHGPMSSLRQPEGPEEKRATLRVIKSMFKLVT